MKEFKDVSEAILSLVNQWENKLLTLNEEVILLKKNKQNRNIKQILGHLIDSASNNTHRIIHLQYQENPMRFPNYATNGNNDRWIAIQHYSEADWNNMIGLWKYSNLHIIHVINHVQETKLNNQWYYSDEKLISLKDGINDYPRHLKLHLDEIEELINK